MTAIIAQTRHGPMLMPPYDVYLSQAMIRLGEYAPDEFETWKRYLFLESIVVDVGANFGAHTFAFARLCSFGMVLAFEPQRMLYNMLCGTVALNGLANVQPKHAALGRAPGHVNVPPMDYRNLGNFGGVELGKVQEGEPVPCFPLDSLRLQRADFVKIDVEGMESEVLAGAAETIARCRPVLSVEADREAQVPALIERLREWNYRLWWHRPLLGELWPNIVSVNLFALPAEKNLPDPEGDVAPV